MAKVKPAESIDAPPAVNVTAVPRKADCPLSAEEFAAHAKPLLITVDGKQVVASVKEFSSGSFGWFAGEKVVIDVGGIPVRVQLGLNMIVVGSKPKA